MVLPIGPHGWVKPTQRNKECRLVLLNRSFKPTRGYGFIVPDDGSEDVFVHISAVEQAGMETLNEGQKISYEIATEGGRTSAANLKAVGSDEPEESDKEHNGGEPDQGEV